MDYEKLIGELKTAWDALEEYSWRGYALRVRINLVQEMILSVYTELVKAKKNAAPRDENSSACAEDKPDKE